MKKLISLIICVMLVMTGAFAEGDAVTFDELATRVWSFSSGAGGWSTDIEISADGTFTGTYHDSEMGETGDDYPDGTIYTCAFSGQMSLVETENGTALHIDKVTLDEEPGAETITDGIRFVTTEPYGITEGDELVVYRPGTSLEGFTEEMLIWAHLLGFDEAPTELGDWFLYSAASDVGFVGIEAGMPNPWFDMTEDELRAASGVTFGVPEGAVDVIYRWMPSEELAEMQFGMADSADTFCARVQPAAVAEGEPMPNISGMYFLWENEEAVTVNGCPGTIATAQTGSEDYVELCQWYDAAPGLMYSLSVGTVDPDGLDLVAIAEMVFVPMQGEN